MNQRAVTCLLEIVLESGHQGFLKYVFWGASEEEAAAAAFEAVATSRGIVVREVSTFIEEPRRWTPEFRVKRAQGSLQETT